MPTCPSCGRESADGYAFCPHCGAALEAATVSREQHEVVTVLFCDVTGSTELGERLDPEALRALLSRYAEAAAELGTAADLFEQNGDGPLAGEARARSQRLL